MVLQAPLGTGEMFKQSLAPLSGEERSLGAKETAMSTDTQGSPATGWPEGAVAVSCLAPGKTVPTTLYPLSLGFFLGPVKTQRLGSVRVRDLIRECRSRIGDLELHPDPKSVPRQTSYQGDHRQRGTSTLLHLQEKAGPQRCTPTHWPVRHPGPRPGPAT